MPDPAPPPAPSTFAWDAALLNLTGLGLGYLVYRRWLALLVSWLAVFLLLGCAGVVTSPGVWLAVLVPWLLVTAAHAGLVPEGRRPLLRLPSVVAAVVTALLAATVAVAAVQFAGQGREIVATAIGAHADDDCDRALTELDRLGPQHAFSFGTYPRAEAEREQCRTLLAARAAAATGAYQEAFTHFATYLDLGGVVDVTPEIGVAYEQVRELIATAEACDALAPVGYLVESDPREPSSPDQSLPEAFGPVSAAARDDHPAALLACAGVRYDAGDLDGAEPLLRELRDTYPDHELTDRDEAFLAEFGEALAVRDIERVAAGAVHRPLPPAQELRRTSRDEVELLLGVSYNAGGRRVEILYTGPETGMVSLGDEDDCNADPVRLTLPPGTYQVLVRAAGFDPESFTASSEPDAEPLQMFGRWDLAAGYEYYQCFTYDISISFD